LISPDYMTHVELKQSYRTLYDRNCTLEADLKQKDEALRTLLEYVPERGATLRAARADKAEAEVVRLRERNEDLVKHAFSRMRVIAKLNARVMNAEKEVALQRLRGTYDVSEPSYPRRDRGVEC
jgi:hypothetical protein